MINTFTESTKPSSQQKVICDVSKLDKPELVDLLDDVKSLQAILRQLVLPIHNEPIEFDTWYQVALNILDDTVKQDITALHALINQNSVEARDNAGGSIKYD